MGVDDVEAVIREPERVGVTDLEVDVDPRRRGVVPCRTKGCLGPVETDHPTRRNEPGEVDRDGARSASDVEEVLAGLQVREQVGRGVRRRPPAMGAQDALVVPVRIRLGRPGHRRQLGLADGCAVRDGAAEFGAPDGDPADGMAPGFGSAASAAVASASSVVSISKTSSPCTYR